MVALTQEREWRLNWAPDRLVIHGRDVVPLSRFGVTSRWGAPCFLRLHPDRVSRPESIGFVDPVAVEQRQFAHVGGRSEAVDHVVDAAVQAGEIDDMADFDVRIVGHLDRSFGVTSFGVRSCFLRWHQMETAMLRSAKPLNPGSGVNGVKSGLLSCFE